MQNDLLPIVILYGFVVSGLPYILYVWALSKIDAGIVAIVSTFELFTAVFASYLVGKYLSELIDKFVRSLV